MPEQPKELGGMPRKELTVFYVLDTSGSMAGEKISALNHAMEECIDALTDLAKEHGDAKLKIAILEFNSGCKWITSNGPEYLEEDFEYEYLETGGLTDVGTALTELNSKLSQRAYLKSMTGALMPIIIFMSDGYATDDWKKPLEKIRENKWFRRATKIGFALGDDPDVSMISSVVGNSEAVIKTTDLELFKRLMKFVTVTSSMTNSTSQTPDTTTTGADIVGESGVEEPNKVQDDELTEEYIPEPETWSEEEDEEW